MGLLEFTSKVVMQYRADVSQAKQEIRSLAGEERKLAEERLKAQEAQNKKLEEQAKRYQFVGAAIAATVATVALASKGLDAYAESSAKGAKEVAKLKESAGKAFDGVMASIGKTVASMAPLINGVTSLVDKLNDVGVAGPAAIGALAFAITGNPAIAGLVALGAAGGFNDVSDFMDPKNLEAMRARRNAAIVSATKTVNSIDLGPSGWEQFSTGLQNAIGQGVRRGLGASEWGPISYGKRSGGDVRAAYDAPYIDQTPYERRGGYSSSLGIAAGPATDEYGREFDPRIRINEQFAAMQADAHEQMMRLAEHRDQLLAGKKSLVLSIFGTPDEMEIVRSGWTSLEAVTTSAFNAMFDGSVSVGEAIKQATAAALKSLGAEMAILALKHTALGFASLALGPLGGMSAKSHFIAAGLLTAGAVAAGGASKGLGGYSAPSGGGAPGGGGGGATVNASWFGARSHGEVGQSSRPIIVVYGDGSSEKNEHERQIHAERAVQRAIGSRGERSR